MTEILLSAEILQNSILGGELKNLKMPTLIIEGRFDRVAVPRFSIKFKEYAPQAKFVMFEKSGHNPYIEQKDKYFELLTDFLQNGK